MKTHRLIITAVLTVLALTLVSCTKSPEAQKAELFSAVKAANMDKVAICIANGAKLNEPETPDGWYPIHYAARSGSLDIVNLLLKNGANPRVHGVSANQANDEQKLSVTPSVVAQLHILAQMTGRPTPFAPDSEHRSSSDDQNTPQYSQIAEVLAAAENSIKGVPGSAMSGGSKQAHSPDEPMAR